MSDTEGGRGQGLKCQAGREQGDWGWGRGRGRNGLTKSKVVRKPHGNALVGKKELKHKYHEQVDNAAPTKLQ